VEAQLLWIQVLQVFEGHQRSRVKPVSKRQPEKITESLFGRSCARRLLVDAGGNADQLQPAGRSGTVSSPVMPPVGETSDFGGDLTNRVAEEQRVKACYVGAGIYSRDDTLNSDALRRSIESLGIPCNEPALDQATQFRV